MPAKRIGPRSLLTRLTELVTGTSDAESPTAGRRYRLSGRGLRIPLGTFGFEVELGSERLLLLPDRAPTEHQAPALIALPPRHLDGVGHFLRLPPGGTLEISPQESEQRVLFEAPREAFRRHLHVVHDGDRLIFRELVSELGTWVTLLDADSGADRLLVRRQAALQRLQEVIGEPFPLPPDAALDLLTAANEQLRRSVHRRRDVEGNPGGLVELPADTVPILVGDIHGAADNLLQVLSSNGFFEALESGAATLVLLGDVVHPEDPSTGESMAGSVQAMDLVLLLMQRFPDRVVLLQGNHDSFSPEVMKAGVPQGLQWEREVLRLRGPAYRDELTVFYQLCPLVALTDDFVACHAGPPRVAVNREGLVNARSNPPLVHELTWNRARSRWYPGGYTPGDVRRFRKNVGLKAGVPLVVGHHPRTEGVGLWQDIEGIEGHHVIYAAGDREIGVFTRVGGEMIAQVYPQRATGLLTEEPATP